MANNALSSPRHLLVTPGAAPAVRPDTVLAHPDPFICTVDVAPGQLSTTIAHVDNIEYLRWIDRGAELHLDACGWSRNDLHAANIMWFVGRHEIDYRAETGPDDHLFLATWVRDVRRVKSWRDTVLWKITADGNARVVCRAATLWVLVDLATRRPKSIPAAMINSLAPLEPAPPRPGQEDQAPCTSP